MFGYPRNLNMELFTFGDCTKDMEIETCYFFLLNILKKTFVVECLSVVNIVHLTPIHYNYAREPQFYEPRRSS